MISWPNELIESIARRKCVLFLGSGVSANAKNSDGKSPATWAPFLKTVLTNHQEILRPHSEEIEKLLDARDYLMACEIIVNEMGERDFGECVATEFRRPGYIPAEIHKVIFSLDSRIVITPNVDKIYEQYACSESNSTIVVKSYSDEDLAKYLRTNDYLIIRAHGSVDESSKMIFTHGQYSKARNKYASFYRLLDALILTHTFIFIGCGINDPDIQLTLENANFLYENCLPHYFVASGENMTPNIKNILDKNRNLRVLTYENEDGEHIELLESLKELSSAVEARREEISQSCTW